MEGEDDEVLRFRYDRHRGEKSKRRVGSCLLVGVLVVVRVFRLAEGAADGGFSDEHDGSTHSSSSPLEEAVDAIRSVWQQLQEDAPEGNDVGTSSSTSASSDDTPNEQRQEFLLSFCHAPLDTHSTAASSATAAIASGRDPVVLPEDFATRFSAWQPKYMRDSLRWAEHFDNVFNDNKLYAQVHNCPALVLEIMMNTVLQHDHAKGREAAQRRYQMTMDTSRSLVKMGLEGSAKLLAEEEEAEGGKAGEQRPAQILFLEKVLSEFEAELRLSRTSLLSSGDEDESSSLSEIAMRVVSGLLAMAIRRKWRTVDVARTYPVLLGFETFYDVSSRTASVVGGSGYNSARKNCLSAGLQMLAAERKRAQLADGQATDEHSTQRLTAACHGQRFYVYELHEIFKSLSILKCAFSQWGTEVLFHRYLEDSPCRVREAGSADWFFVPMYSTCLYAPLWTKHEKRVEENAEYADLIRREGRACVLEELERRQGSNQAYNDTKAEDEGKTSTGSTTTGDLHEDSDDNSSGSELEEVRLAVQYGDSEVDDERGLMPETGCAFHDLDNVANRELFRPAIRDALFFGSKHYNRRRGTDHIFLFADGQGPRIFANHQALQNSVFLSVEATCPTWEIRPHMHKELDVYDCLQTQTKDVVIPGLVTFDRAAGLRKANRPVGERDTLMVFHGRHPEHALSHRMAKIRGHVLDLFATVPGADVSSGFVEDYFGRKGRAIFCLVPGGSSPWTVHLYESFFAGCIPVILSDEYQVPFRAELPWEEFSVKWPEKKDLLYPGLYEHLQRLVGTGRHVAMKAAVDKYRCWFDYFSESPVCNPFVMVERKLKKRLLMRWLEDEESFDGIDEEPDAGGKMNSDGDDSSALRLEDLDSTSTPTTSHRSTDERPVRYWNYDEVAGEQEDAERTEAFHFVHYDRDSRYHTTAAEGEAQTRNFDLLSRGGAL